MPHSLLVKPVSCFHTDLVSVAQHWFDFELPIHFALHFRSCWVTAKRTSKRLCADSRGWRGPVVSGYVYSEPWYSCAGHSGPVQA